MKMPKSVSIGALLAVTALAGVLRTSPARAEETAPQVEQLFLGEFQELFQKDAGKVRIVALLAPS